MNIRIVSFPVYFLLFASTMIHAEEIRVAVAANFSAPVKKIAGLFEKETGNRVTLTFGTVGQFYSQIKNGAPFDVLISADRSTPDKLVADGLALNETRYTYAIGKLVLWSLQPGLVKEGGDVLRHGTFKHLSLANPKLAVYGAAGEEVMKRMGIYDQLKSRIVLAENITQAYQFVASGNAEIGFVALSQVIDGNGKISRGSYWMVPANMYPKIEQDAIVLSRGKDKNAAHQLIGYLKKNQVKDLIRSYGYVIEENNKY
jgi:molybdate transport system substrate-binding protein